MVIKPLKGTGSFYARQPVVPPPDAQRQHRLRGPLYLVDLLAGVQQIVNLKPSDHQQIDLNNKVKFLRRRAFVDRVGHGPRVKGNKIGHDLKR